MNTFTVVIEDRFAAQAKAANDQDKPAPTSTEHSPSYETTRVIIGSNHESAVGKTNGSHNNFPTSDQRLLDKSANSASTSREYTTWDLLSCR